LELFLNTEHCIYTDFEKFPEYITNKIKSQVENNDISLKVGLKVMVTENLDVLNKICKGAYGIIESINYLPKEKYEHYCLKYQYRTPEFTLMDTKHKNKTWQSAKLS